MKFSDITTSIVEQFKHTPDIAYCLLSQPGSGKSALAREIATHIQFDKVVEFNAGLRDPVDLLGSLRNNNVVTEWVPPKELHQLSSGKNLWVIEELTDATLPMQNGLCGLIYDRKLNDLVLSPETYIVASGNRTEDKSGANRLSTKLGNRMRLLDFDVDLDDWCEWALSKNIDHVLVQFLRFKPNLLAQFDPNRRSNPTPRAWERVAKTPTTMPASIYYGTISGDVGEGAAAEYVGFRKIYEGLPNIDGILLRPADSDIPKDPAVLYALTGALAHRATKDNFDRVAEYVMRMPADFQVMCINDATKKKPELKNTKSFINWAVKNAEVML